MDDPIVSPWLIYLIGVSGNLQGVLVGLSVLFGMCGAAIFVVWKMEGKRWAEVLSKRFLLITSICIPLAVVIPSKNTVIGMIVAEHVTQSSVEAAKSEALDIIHTIQEEVQCDKRK